MTKPANFPGRINERRRSALRQIEAQLKSGTKRSRDMVEPLSVADVARLGREADALTLRIVAFVQARAVRTKKTKALGWSAARAAYRSGRLA